MKSVISVTILALLGHAPLAVGSVFSVGPGTPDVLAGFPPNEDILFPAPGIGAPPGLALPGGLPGGNVDAFSFNGLATLLWEFSVDIGAAGLPATAVAAQVAGGGEAHYDIFSTTLTGSNVLLFDGNGLPPAPVAPPLGLDESVPFATPFGVNGVDANPAPAGLGIYWSVDPPTTGGAPYLGASPADVFFAPIFPGFAGAPGPYAGALVLGLIPGGDNIDALHIVDVGAVGVFDAGDSIYFSLDPSSASLGAFGGAGPADILVAPFGAPTAIFAPAVALGLLPGDNLNALTSVVPEAAESSLIMLGLLGFMANRRRRRHA